MSLLNKKRKYSKSEFDYKNLPQTRKEQFYDLLKHRYRLLLKVGLAMVLFALPLILTIFVNQYYKIGFNQALNSGNISNEDYANSMFLLAIIINSVFVIDFVILSIGISGLTRVLRQLIYGESIYFWHDFQIGVKSNFKHLMLNAIFLGIINFVCSIIFIYYGLLSFFGVLITLLTSFIALPFFTINLAYVPVYDNTIASSYKNSFLVCLSLRFKSLLLMLIVILPSLVLMVPVAGLSIILFVLSLIFIYPTILLGFFLYMYNHFDRVINTKYYKEIIRKGLYNGEDLN